MKLWNDFCSWFGDWIDRNPKRFAWLVGAVLLLLVVLAIAAPTAHADHVLSWTKPVANKDGSTPATISGYNIWKDTTEAGLTAQKNTAAGSKPWIDGSVLNSPDVLSYRFNLPLGTYWFAVTAWYCDASKCFESAQGPHISLTIPRPAAPTDGSIQRPTEGAIEPRR